MFIEELFSRIYCLYSIVDVMLSCSIINKRIYIYIYICYIKFHGCKSQGGLEAPLVILLGWLAMDPAPPEKPGFSLPTFRNMRGLARLIVTVTPSSFFLQLKLEIVGLIIGL